MKKRVLVLVGTRKGAFILEGDARRKSWELRGPFCEHWPMNHVVGDAETGTIYGGGGNEWFGPAVWKSTDLGKSWTHSSEGLAYEAGEEPIKAVWSLAPSATAASMPACSRPACSAATIGGETWQHVEGLQKHPSRPAMEARRRRARSCIRWCRIPTTRIRSGSASRAAGVFHTADGGETWEPRNRGTRADFLPEDQNYPEFGQCVHCLVMAPGMPDRLYQQNHCGMYRSDDGGKSWQSIENGLPSSFGFPAAAHPRDPDTLFLLPLNGDSKPAATCRTPRPRSGARATPARAGRTCATACRRRTPISACCARRWRPTGWSRPASISAPAPARCSPAPTRATAGCDRRASADDLIGRDAGRRA